MVPHAPTPAGGLEPARLRDRCPAQFTASLFAVDWGTTGLLLAGFVVLVGGGELLVRGASGLAAAFGMSPLVIGLTVVSFATSAPELAVTLQSVRGGSPDLAVGNVVGSCIANVLLILGVAAVIASLAVKSQLVRIDVPVMVAMSALLLVLSLDGEVSAVDAGLLVTCLAAYVTTAVVLGRREARAEEARSGGSRSSGPGLGASGVGASGVGASEVRGPAPSEAAGHESRPAARQQGIDLALLVTGVAALVIGAGWLVDGATRVATQLGVPDVVIGLTIVAIGTSLPELATTVIASIRGERDLAVGNAVGSNIFNIGAVLGVSTLLAPDGGIPVAESVIRFDMPVMVAAAVALLPVVHTGFQIHRWEGVLFLGLYASYTAYLLMDATDHERLPAFSAIMLFFVLPVVGLTLGVLAGYDAGLRRGRAEAAAADRVPQGG